MIKKMRRRLILSAMLAFSSVIIMIAVLVNTVNFFFITNNADRTLSVILKFEENRPEKPSREDVPSRPFRGLPDVESNYMTRFFTVRFDAEKNVIFTSTDYIAAIDKEDAIILARQVLDKNADHGYLKVYRYVKEEKENTTEVAFLNTTREQQNMVSLFFFTIIISAVSILIVFVLVTIFSKKAIRPIANNINQQKQFITDASHELKTPLTSISTSLDVITMTYEEDEWTDNIKEQTGRMSKLVNELVSLSRLDEETPLPKKEEFSLSQAAWEIIEVYRPQIKAHEKTLTENISDNVFMRGDKTAIQQMFSVLLDNAIRYSDKKGDISININKKRNRIKIEFFNTCQYDKLPDVDRLFDRFYRPDNSRSTETGSTGLGLSIAKAVTLAHGGRISADCPDGKTMSIKICFFK